MLRITVHHKLGALTFQLEGRLAGPWVRVLHECWQSELARPSQPILRVDVTALQRQGAEFVASDCLTKAIVEEITRPPGIQA